MLLKVRQRSVLKAIWNPGATDGLLSHTSNHLWYVYEGTWGTGQKCKLYWKNVMQHISNRSQPNRGENRMGHSTTLCSQPRRPRVTKASYSNSYSNVGEGKGRACACVGWREEPLQPFTVTRLAFWSWGLYTEDDREKKSECVCKSRKQRQRRGGPRWTPGAGSRTTGER